MSRRRLLVTLLTALALCAATFGVAVPTAFAASYQGPLKVTFGRCIVGQGQPKIPVTVTNVAPTGIQFNYGRFDNYGEGSYLEPGASLNLTNNLVATTDVEKVRSTDGWIYSATCKKTFHPNFQPNSAVPGCGPVQFIGVRGSGEKNSDYGGFGRTIAAVKDYLIPRVPALQTYAIDYPAVPVGYGKTLYPLRYDDSESTGVHNLSAYLISFEHTCPGTKIVLAGFSQGGQVAADEYQLLPEDLRVAITLITFGEPGFNPGQPSVDFGDYDPQLSGVLQFSGAIRTFDAADIPSVHTFCVRGDPVCGFTILNAAGCKLLSGCIHDRYPDLGYTDQASIWALSRVS